MKLEPATICRIEPGELPETLAELWAAMDANGQARFFNRIAEVASPWLSAQLQYLTDDDGLTLAGRRVMSSIGDYSHWGLVPRGNTVEEEPNNLILTKEEVDRWTQY